MTGHGLRPGPPTLGLGDWTVHALCQRLAVVSVSQVQHDSLLRQCSLPWGTGPLPCWTRDKPLRSWASPTGTPRHQGWGSAVHPGDSAAAMWGVVCTDLTWPGAWCVVCSTWPCVGCGYGLHGSRMGLPFQCLSSPMENSSYESCGGGVMGGSPTLGRVFPTGQFYRVSSAHVIQTLGRQDTDLLVGLLAR